MESKKQEKKFDIDIKKYILLCIKSWPIFLLSVGVCGLLAVVAAVTQTPKSEVMAQIMLKDDTSASSMMMAGQIARSFSLGDMFGGTSTTDNESMVLKSHAVFVKTAKDLGLNTMCYERKYGFKWVAQPTMPSLRVIAPAGVADTLSVRLVFRVKDLDNGKFDITAKARKEKVASLKDQTLPTTVSTPYGDYIIDKTDYYGQSDASTYRLTYSSYNAAASSYEQIVNIFVPDRKTDFIDLSFTTNDPKFGKLLLNTLIDNYVQVSNIFKVDRSNQSLELVDNRLSTLQAELQQSEIDLEKFKVANKLTDVEVDAQYLMSKTAALDASLLQAQTNFEVIKMTKDFLANPENKFSLIPDLYPNMTSQSGENSVSLIGQYNSLILQRMRMVHSAKESNTNIRSLDEQIEALRGNIVSSIDRAYNNARQSLNDIKGEDNRNKSRIGELPALEREYIILKRDNMLQEQIYLFLLQQREELTMSLAKTSYPAQVIDAPYVLADPPGLSKPMIVLIGLFFGFVLAALYVFFLRMGKSPVISRSEIEGAIGAPVLDCLPAVKGGVDGLAVLGDDEMAEKLRKLRSDVVFALKGCNGKTVVVTSPLKSEGKTFVAVNLAAGLAAIGKKVALVDVATRDAKVAAVLGIRPSATGLDLMGQSNPKVGVDTVSVNANAAVDVITSSKLSGNPADVVASDGFAALISSLKDVYDYVVIDSTQIKGYSDIYALTDLADMTLVVCRAGYSTPEDVALVKKLYDDGRLKRIAIVENAFS